MSTSIRPGGAVTPGSAGVEAAPEIAPAEAAEAQRVDASSAAGGVAPASTAPADSPTAVVLARLDAGEVTREQAIEGLVSEALQLHGGAKLPPAQRAELEGMLRAALLEDPALASLLG